MSFYRPGGSGSGSITTLPVQVGEGGTGATTAGDARTNLGLGSIATQAASNVAITGGTIGGITDIAVVDGGTGASTAAGARSNLLPSYTGNANKVLSLNGTATDVEWTTNGAGSVTSVDASVPTGLAVSGGPITSSGTLAFSYASGYAIPTTAKQTEWDSAYTDRLKWDGGSTGLNASTARTSLGLGTAATTDSSDYAPAAKGVTNGDSHDHNGGDGAQISYNNLSNLPTLGTIASQAASNVSITGGSITGITDLAIADGGTGASTAQNAINNLLPSQSTQAGKYLKTDGTDVSWDALDISTADITGTLPIANGGTGSTSASAARTALGLAIGTDVQAYDAQLADIAGLTPTDNNFIVGNGTNFVTESGSTARTSLGLGSIATQDASNVSITGGSVTGITDLAVADGGTGASDASGARTNLGLGSIATQAANNVSITGGSISGITDLAVADGGTGASTAANARVNLLPSYTSNNGKVLAVNTGGTDVEWISAGGSGTVTSVDMTVPTGLAVSGNPITASGTLALTYASGYAIPTTSSQTNWDTAYTDRLKWDGGSTGLTASTGRTSLGATTLGSNLFTITNPSAITFPRFNADNTVSSLSAADFRTAVGAGTGTVTSVALSGGTTGLTVSGSPITGSGTITLAGTLAIANGGTGATTLAGANIPVTNASNTFTSAQTFRAASAIRSEAASTQDAIVLAGRAGGTGSFAVTLTPNTLSANRTVTFPDAATNIPIASQTLTFSGPTAARTYTLPDAATTVVGTDTTQTLTNKTISADNNTLSGIAASSFVLSNSSGNIDGAAAQKAIPSGVVVGTTDTQTLTNKTLTDPVIIGTVLEDVFTITDGAAFEIDPGNGSIQLITLGASRTPKATNFAAGESVTLMVDDGTAYTLTWTDTTFGTSGVVWKTNGGVAPTLNTSGYTVIVLWKVGTQIYGARVGDA